MAAPQEVRFPMERKLARLAAASSESLANAVAVQRRPSLTSFDLAAATVPRPRTKSLMPIFRMSSMSAPAASCRPASRIGTPGAAMSAIPTPVRSHPIVSQLLIGTVAAYFTYNRSAWCGPRGTITIFRYGADPGEPDRPDLRASVDNRRGVTGRAYRRVSARLSPAQDVAGSVAVPGYSPTDS